MNRQRLFLVIFAVIISMTATSQLLWKVSGNGLTKSSYIFGTHHVINKEQINHFDQIMAFCSQSEAVVGELDMGDPTIQMKIMQGASLTEGTLKDLMSEEDYALVDTEFKQTMGFGLEPLNKMKPMLLTSIYTVMAYIKATGMDKQPEAVDMLFQKKAKEKGLKVLGLETADKQVSLLFNSIPVKRQIELLVQCVREKDESIEQINQLNKAYLAGDLKQIESIGDGEDWTPEEKLLIVDQRNLDWASQLPALMTEQSCFVAIGCLHLVGESGLINQLTKVGYKVEGVVF